MRCSNCGKKLKKKSSFCIKCGAKVPPIPKKDKKVKKKKKSSKAKIVIPFFIILILAILSFLLFGGDKVPEKVRDLKGYSYLTGMVKEKLPEKVRLPFDLPDKFPFDFTFKLPFELPNPGSLLGESEIPDKKKIMEDLSAYEGGEENQLEFDSLEIEKRTTVEKEKKDTIYVLTETTGEEGKSSNYYRLLYKRHLIGGWKLDTVKPYNVGGEKTSVAGVDNEIVMNDKSLYADISSDWKHSKVKVLEHYTDVKAGTDIVVVYLELQNEYVKMVGTKEIMYQYNEETKKWEPGPASKLTCLSIKPVSEPL
ncbi:MAG TPA: zinc ribbon domain-containing protein [Anaerovoracaceae bacterium]|nr:zinc ribbon domain-containing protein [Anaerovoracaceae bacterium]